MAKQSAAFKMAVRYIRSQLRKSYTKSIQADFSTPGGKIKLKNELKEIFPEINGIPDEMLDKFADGVIKELSPILAEQQLQENNHGRSCF